MIPTRSSPDAPWRSRFNPSIAFWSRSTPSEACSMKRRPAGVNTTPVLRRSNNCTPSLLSRRSTRRLTVDCETSRVFATRRKLPYSAARIAYFMNRRSRERSVIPEVLLVFSIIRTLETKHLVLMLIIRSWDRLIFTILFKRTRRTAENDRLVCPASRVYRVRLHRERSRRTAHATLPIRTRLPKWKYALFGAIGTEW